MDVPGTEPDITAVIQVPPSDTVRSVTMQCSVLSGSEKKTCPGGHSVCWFRAGSDESHPSFIYTHGNSDDECESRPDEQSSDAGTYSCAVVTCGHKILFGNLTKLDIPGNISI